MMFPRGKRYATIVVDPPWNQGKTGRRRLYPNQGVELPYPTMTREEIALLPVGELAADQALLFLWATNSKDRASGEPILKMAFDILEGWGFTYYTTITWGKPTGVCPFGPYQIVTEHVLFGYRGKLRFPKESWGRFQNLVLARAASHSTKPQVFYDQLVNFTPEPRIDLFARQVRPGFDGWGNEYPLEAAA